MFSVQYHGSGHACSCMFQVMACNMMDVDTSEGIDAFIDKRKPTWQKERESDDKISTSAAPEI